MAHVFIIADCATRLYFKNPDWDTAVPEELGRAFSLLIKLPRSVKNKIFTCQMCDFDFRTIPFELLVAMG